jgi:bifunctional DNA-binding transcriptional regulator/antitoxin component of YhaV-PrlF toxin-antitoxin module
VVHRSFLVKHLYLAFQNVLVETVKLVETTLKKLDAQGRIAIPAAWRRGWKSGKVILIKRGEKIELSPIELVSPSSLFDSIEISDNVDFTDSHSLRRALLERTTH